MTTRAGCCHICHSNDKKWQVNKWQSVGDGSWHCHSINGRTSLKNIQDVFNLYMVIIEKDILRVYFSCELKKTFFFGIYYLKSSLETQYDCYWDKKEKFWIYFLFIFYFIEFQ